VVHPLARQKKYVAAVLFVVNVLNMRLQTAKSLAFGAAYPSVNDVVFVVSVLKQHATLRLRNVSR
jgi:hypothetical protein